MADPLDIIQKQRRLRRLKRLTTLLDSRWGIPFTQWRFGLDGLIGLLPGGGDLITTLMSAYIISEAGRLGVSRTIVWRMTFNVLVDLGVGLVPIAGDIADVAFKANVRNLQLIERDLARQGVTVD